MNYYDIRGKDQARSSWVLFSIEKPIKERPRHKELPPVFYKFFRAAPEREMRLKPIYQKYFCKSCGRYDTHRIFDAGFEEPVTIRIKGDFATTDDGLFVVSDKFLHVLKSTKVGGYESKPIGKSGWHALRVTLHVGCDERVVTTKRPKCRGCDRPRTAFGIFEAVSQLSLPKENNTLFTTKKSWPYATGRGRQIFCTEEVAKALKAGGVTGGWCTRLVADEELKKMEDSPSWTPPGFGITL